MIKRSLENFLRMYIINVVPANIKLKLSHFFDGLMFLNNILLNYFFIFIKKFQKVTFFLAFDHSSNFGDAYNINLFEYYNIKYQIVNYSRANILGVGSIIQNYLDSQKVKSKILGNKHIIFCGSGFIQPISVKKYELQDNFSVKSPVLVRGKMSKQILAEIFKLDNSSFMLGDPGLLMRKVFQERFNNRRVKYDIGIIPHYVDKDINWNMHINLEKYSYKVINVLSGVENVINDILSSKFIFSSSLHGLIAADSFSIPNCRLIASDGITGGEFKFEDYYSVFSGRKKLYLDLNRSELNDSNFEIIAASFVPYWEMISKIIDNLDSFYSEQIRYTNR